MKMMIKKTILLFTILIMSQNIIHAQGEDLQWLDLELSNYEYPYEVKRISLHIQNQDLTMAYMDIEPSNYNGKNVMLLHGKGLV